MNLKNEKMIKTDLRIKMMVMKEKYNKKMMKN